MSKRTVVSDYIQTKLNEMKKDSFLESIKEKSVLHQTQLIEIEINNIYTYITTIKKDKNSYEITDGKKRLKSNISKQIKVLKNIILEYQKYLKYISLLEKYGNRVYKENVDIYDLDIETEYELNEVFDFEGLLKLSSEELTKLSRCLIKSIESLENYNQLFEIVQELVQRFANNNYGEKEFALLSSIKSFLTNKIHSLDKNSQSRKFLSTIKKYIKSNLNISKEIDEKEHDYRYEILEYFIEDEYLFDRILEEMPDVINLCDIKGKSITYNVMLKFLDAYLLELQGQTGKIPKEKYAKIYRKLINHPAFNVLLLKDIKILMTDFIEAIKTGNFKRDKFLEAAQVLEKIGEETEYLENETMCFNNDELYFESYNILEKRCEIRKFNLSHEDTIVIRDNNQKYNNYAYTICKDGQGTHILKVHITDVREFIKNGTELDDYLKYHMFYNLEFWLDEKLLEKFSLTKGEAKPVYTFEFKVCSSGEIEAFKIYKSTINVNDIYSIDEVNAMIKKHDYRFLPYLEVGYFLNPNMNKDNYGISMTDAFNRTTLELVGKYFSGNKLPYIYKAQKEQNSEKYMNSMSYLNYYFYKISDEHFKTFYQIICEDTNYAYYTNKCEYHNTLAQKYYTDLLIPLHSYIGIHLQQLIDEFYFNKYSKDTLKIKETIWKEENKFIIDRANEIRNEKRVEKHLQKIKNRGVAAHE